ncbi:putative neuraminidase [Neolewinella xylanilytica]|uniref:Putative neuraminidase n=1 Tax=Neolewinella xylanilytica TaxID=1514080 RepID=A0A2S6I9C4_9BACT|nr:sialidase family protein [Neolewinella xylanilytica]PPK88095.1 putative neuraminidase [Neolewinella xylanilytica]
MACLLTLLIMLVLSSLDAQVPEVLDFVRTDVFDEGPTPACHAATIVETTPGRLLTAWFGGSYEGAKDVGIYLARSRGQDWSEPRQLVAAPVVDGDTLPCWNPVLFQSQSKRLYLFFKVGPNPREWRGAVVTSDDDGATWTKPAYLPEGFLGPVRNKPVETEPGVILCGSSTESPTTDAWRVHLERYREATDTWEKVAVPNSRDFEIIQPAILRHGGDTLQILCRSKHDRLIGSWSYDGGASWTDADSLPVPNANSGVDALTLSTGNFLLVNNPLPMGDDWWNGRNVLDVAFSTDGVDWLPLVDLERHEEGEYSYPAIIQAADGTVHVVYTYDRKKIRHARFRLVTAR